MLGKSLEDYLEAILILRKKGTVRSVDLAGHMGYSKASVSRALKLLRTGGFVTVDEHGRLHLTAAGRAAAEKINERHRFFAEQLVAAGVDQETAERDACQMEHAISDLAFQKLKKKMLQGGR